jgi:four helix bundle protein
MTEDELKMRTKKFALRTMRLVEALPKTAVGRAIGGQLVRSGTSVGANYRAACRARSKAEFIAKIAVADEEADESAYWMELIVEGGLMPEKIIAALRQEASELAKIMSSSRKSASRAIFQSKIQNQKSKMGNG